MSMELRWDYGTEVVICAAAKHGVNNLPDGSLNRRGNRRSRAETKESVGGGGSFLAPWQFGASLRETNGVLRSRCCQSVMTGSWPQGSLARDGQRLSCPIRNDGQQATPTARVPPVGKNVKGGAGWFTLHQVVAPFRNWCPCDLEYSYS